MIDLFFQIVLNNVCISLALAIIAAIVGITLKRPAITHLLWLLVFVKLLTPPFLMISVNQNLWMGETNPPVNLSITEQKEMQIVEGGKSSETINSSTATAPIIQIQGKHWLLITWLSGSMIVLIWSIRQIYRFHRLLKKESETGPPEIQSKAKVIAACLSLKAVPAIHTISANISPMVWWIGGKVWVVIPTAILKQLNAEQFKWILSHELAHVRRRDYMIRWIEWLVCVCFWWNPVTWWARYNLRANEELCCDALVLAGMRPKPYTYGDSLVKAIEILTLPTRRPLVMASGINNAGLLKGRVKMIVSDDLIKSKLRWLQACIMLGALIVLPLGLTKAQDTETKEKIPEFKETLLEEGFSKLVEQQSIEEDDIRLTQKNNVDGDIAIASSTTSDKSVSKVMSASSEALGAESSQKDIRGQNVGKSETMRTEKLVASVSSTGKIAEKADLLEVSDAVAPSFPREISGPDDESFKGGNESAPLSIMDTNNKTDGKTFLVSEVDTPPSLVRVIPPKYPYRAKRNNYTGRVTLQFVVSKEGYAVDARVIRSDPPEVKEVFEESALETLEQYRFKPAMKDGEAVDVRGVNQPIVFELTSGKK